MATAMMASRYSVRQSSSVAGLKPGWIFSTVGEAWISQPASVSASRRGMRWVPIAALSTRRVSAAPQMPVRRIFELTTMRVAMPTSAEAST
ncbi:hypothetical protein D3C72_2012670 [compost metagenome]